MKTIPANYFRDQVRKESSERPPSLSAYIPRNLFQELKGTGQFGEIRVVDGVTDKEDYSGFGNRADEMKKRWDEWKVANLKC